MTLGLAAPSGHLTGQMQQKPPPPGAPPGSVTVLSSELTVERQQKIEAFVRSAAERIAAEVGDRLRSVTLGILNPQASLGVTRWSGAAWLWTKEKPVQAEAYLALGVLYDCLGRMQVVQTPTMVAEENRPFWPDQVAARPGLAVKNFDKALEIAPSLLEARFRSARIRARRDARAAEDLEALAETHSGTVFGYLAAISRAEVARADGDSSEARRWYERARALRPRSMAAAIGLASLGMPGAMALDDLDPDDVYYTYPCAVLTPTAAAGLDARVQKIGVK